MKVSFGSRKNMGRNTYFGPRNIKRVKQTPIRGHSSIIEKNVIIDIILIILVNCCLRNQ